MSLRRRAGVLAGAIAIDLALGDAPNRWHPVAWFGSGANAAIARLPRGSSGRNLGSGLALAIGGGAGAMAAGGFVAKLARVLPGPLAFAAEAFALKQALSARGLAQHAIAVARPLEEGDLAAAREAVRMMVSRDVDALGEAAIASAAIESTAENASDSVIAPAMWYLVGGLPLAWAYRALNTLDAMVGYRKHGIFGSPAARADDALNLTPSRLTAGVIAIVSADPGATWRAARAEAGRTPSPNSGWPMAAAARALGVRLEKPGVHVLNEEGREPAAGDIRGAVRLLGRGLAFVAAGAALFAAWPRGAKA
ncbi:MAG: adenosylcobinamide-phosphate synthase CbiB [Dehalococcoidia bacterium]